MSMNSGIYQIKNLKTGLLYIGRTIRWNERKRRHLSDLRRGAHKNPRLQHSWDARNPHDFEFKLIWPEAPEHLEELEAFLLEELFDTGLLYNAHKNSVGGSLGQVWTEDQRAKISAIHTGRKHTPETRARMSASNLASEKARVHHESLRTPEMVAKRTAAAKAPDVRARAVETRKANGYKPFTDESRQKKKDDAKARLFLALDWAVANSASRGEALTKFNCSWGSLKLYQPEWELINGVLNLPKRASGEKSGMFKHGLSSEIRRKRTPEELEESRKAQSEAMSGKNNPMFGRKHTEAARAIQSQAALKQAETRKEPK